MFSFFKLAGKLKLSEIQFEADRSTKLSHYKIFSFTKFKLKTLLKKKRCEIILNNIKYNVVHMLVSHSI